MTDVRNITTPYHLVFGIIVGSIQQIIPLLRDINELNNCCYLSDISLCLLVNGVSAEELRHSTTQHCASLSCKNIMMLTHNNEEKLAIAAARCILQKHIGQIMIKNKNMVAWFLDDDMRIPESAQTYLAWLPSLKQRSVDVVIGCIDGGSPNPAAHGMRVQINDLLHNLNWLETLKEDDVVPDRSAENAIFREHYPDYYYDLSRKHQEHLDQPYWLETKKSGITVKQARQDMLANLNKIFTGEPFLRPVINKIAEPPFDPLLPSCNRGGNCFVLNPECLILTPNVITKTNGVLNRRSDMIWAIINRYYYKFNIVAINFPIYHHRFINSAVLYDLEKRIAEIVGSSMYASLCDFFQNNPNHDWHFTLEDATIILQRYHFHSKQRLEQFICNQKVINNLLSEIEQQFSKKYPPLLNFIEHAKELTTKTSFIKLQDICKDQDYSITEFLRSFPAVIDDYSKSCKNKTYFYKRRNTAI